MDLLAGFLGGNETALVGGFHSLLEDATGCGINLTFGFVGNKWIDAFGLAHTLNLAQLPGERNWLCAKSGKLSSSGLRRGTRYGLHVRPECHDQPIRLCRREPPLCGRSSLQ